MTKKEIQKYVSQNGAPLPLSAFKWNARTLTFSSSEKFLSWNKPFCDSYTFNTGAACTFIAGNNCTFNTGANCITTNAPVAGSKVQLMQ